MYEIPVSVTICNEEFNIRNRGDYRMILDCFVALSDTELTVQERLAACLCIFYDDIESLEDLNILPDMQEAVSQMYKFFNCGQEEIKNPRNDYKLIDWETDEQLVSSAINKIAGKEVRLEEYLHWWTFMGYYMAVGESPLSHVVSIRHKIVKGKQLEKHEREFRRDNPQYFNWDKKTVSQKEAEDWALSLWNKGKDNG